MDNLSFRGKGSSPSSPPAHPAPHAQVLREGGCPSPARGPGQLARCRPCWVRRAETPLLPGERGPIALRLSLRALSIAVENSRKRNRLQPLS